MTTTLTPYQPFSVDGLEHDEQNALDELMSIWRSKRHRNIVRQQLYDMKNATRALMSSAVPEIVKQRSFVLGWPSTAVDKLNRRCNIDGFYALNGEDLDSFGMAEIVRENRLLDELSQAGISSLIHTPSWLITTQGDVASGDPEVLINTRDALTGAGVWDGRRRVTKYYVSLNDFDDSGEPTDLALYMPGRNIPITLKRGRYRAGTVRKHAYGVPVDPLRYRPRIARPLGSSRINRAVISLHQQALAAMIRADVNGEAYSLARYVLLGATESAFQNSDGTPKPAFMAAWDAIWAIGDDFDAPEGKERADVKQFNGQSPEPQNAHLRMLAQLFSGETGIPIGELGIIGDSNPTSWEAMETSREDIIAEAEQAARTWKPDISAAVRRALEMKNKGDIPADLVPVPDFRPAQHVSRSAAADSGSKIIDKVPWLGETSVGLELLGLSKSQAERAMGEKRRIAGTAALRDILARVSSTETDDDADAAAV